MLLANMDRVLSAILLQTDVNYVELVLLAHKCADTTARSYEIDIPVAEFYEKLKTISKQKNIKYFVKRLKRYRVGEMVLELTPADGDTSEQRVVLRQTPASCCVVDKALLCVGYIREKAPLHQFPCTLNLHEVCYVQRLTFRLHNRVYLNFEIQRYIDGQAVHKAYLNYNHDHGTERSGVAQLLGEYAAALIA